MVYGKPCEYDREVYRKMKTNGRSMLVSLIESKVSAEIAHDHSRAELDGMNEINYDTLSNLANEYMINMEKEQVRVKIGCRYILFTIYTRPFDGEKNKLKFRLSILINIIIQRLNNGLTCYVEFSKLNDVTVLIDQKMNLMLCDGAVEEACLTLTVCFLLLLVFLIDKVKEEERKETGACIKRQLWATGA
ncbi:hypothetical protein C0J52_14322 [Blattella germanica]|nr:hypothetical protein C0J52_14322 [Blattella germanica]